MNAKVDVPEKSQRPKHVAIIMDGNGRWALERGMERLDGHREGANVVREITTFSRELEIPYLTLYSFSVQNWTRPPEEVAGLMQLLEEYSHKERDSLMDNDIRVTTIGDLSRLPVATRVAVDAICEETAANRAMTLTLAIDYGGREEMVAAVRRVALDLKAKRLTIDAIDETAIESRLYTALMPDPDFVIRTSGEFRVSNFLLWQTAYAEFHFTDLRWPEFDRPAFAHALWEYAARERRFGGLAGQLTAGAGDDTEGEFVLGDLPDTEEEVLEKGREPC